jgi:acyl-CoA thioesterase I
LSDVIQQCQKAGADVVLAGMTLPPNYTRTYIQAFEQIYVDLARQYQAALIPFFLEGVATRPELNLEDGIHPNAEGCKIVAANVLKALLPLLKK